MNQAKLIHIRSGTIIASRYKVTRRLGTGSMGVVYACTDKEEDDQLVAMKVLFPEVAQDRVALRRFRNEIFASYGVIHENVVRAFDYIRDGEITGYTLEYVGGGDLADKLGEDPTPIPIREIVGLLIDMCAGLQAIHDAGIVHRDMKPENILLTELGRAKIADFGIARTGSGQKLTEHGGVVGTIDYVSPEYMLNSHVDWRSDIYALGILGYEMVTQEQPFRGESVYATMMKRLKTEPRMPSAIRTECPPELERIILKAMARAIEERYQSSEAMLHDLLALQQQLSRDSVRYSEANEGSLREGSPKRALLAEKPRKGKRASSGGTHSSRVKVRDILPIDQHESGLERRTSMAEGTDIAAMLPVSGQQKGAERGRSSTLWRGSSAPSGFGDFGESEPVFHSRANNRPRTGLERIRFNAKTFLTIVLFILLSLALTGLVVCGLVYPSQCGSFLPLDALFMSFSP
ncbi:serine/threonine protein kinase [bacterium]|nr:serine/threonine protein kinase [bacterium]